MALLLHSTNCPKCNVLKAKLNSAGLEFEVNDDVEKMLALGIQTVPYLQNTETGALINFAEAINYINYVIDNKEAEENV